jgi:hypothetical protein
MPARLSIHPAIGPVSVHRIEDGGDCVLGRAAEADVQVIDDRVSRRHARISHRPGEGWRVVDLGSKNGLFLDDCRIDATSLPAAAELSLGGVPVRFEPLADAAARADAERELDRHRDGVRLQRRLDPAVGLRELLDRLLTSVMQVVGADRGFLLLTHPDGDLRLARVSGLAEEDLAGEEFGGSLSASRQAMAERQPVICYDASSDTRLSNRPSVQSGGIRLLVCLPLVVLDRVTGVVYADSREPGRELTELDVEILEGLASYAALALAVAGLQDEVEGLEGALGRAGEAGGRPLRRLTATHELLEIP